LRTLALLFLLFSFRAAPQEPIAEPVDTITTPSESIEATSEPIPSDLQPEEEVSSSTPTENAVAANVLLVARGNGNIPPFEWENENGVQGIHIDLVRAVGKRLGYKVDFETVAWKRALIKMQVKACDAITYVSKTVDREEFIFFMEGNIISKTNVHFFTIDQTEKKEKMTFWKIRSFKDFKEWISGKEPPPFEPLNIDRSIYNLKENKFAVQKGYSYGDEFENIEGINKVFAGTIYDLKNYILSGEANIGLVDIDYFSSLFKDESFFKRVRFSKDPYFVSMNYIGFSKKPQNLELAKKFADEMIAFKKTQDYKDLLLKYNIKNP
jgi:polar amino acid transport system substrate-binding protein